jgi:hypothetical protein
MDRRIAVVLYVVAMAAVIVGVDFVFFRNRFWERLIVNIGIVLVFRNGRTRWSNKEPRCLLLALSRHRNALSRSLL